MKNHINSLQTVTLILGGVKSGKSKYALQKGEMENFSKRYFLATACALDLEMKQAIQMHQQQRAAQWITMEEPYMISQVFQNASWKKTDLLVLDCLTLWLSNLLSGIGGKKMNEQEIVSELEHLTGILQTIKASVYIVSNEVGLGVIGSNALARQFVRLQGIANQRIAAQAERVFYLTAGIVKQLK